jgi:hypothetical protein
MFVQGALMVLWDVLGPAVSITHYTVMQSTSVVMFVQAMLH